MNSAQSGPRPNTLRSFLPPSSPVRRRASGRQEIHYYTKQKRLLIAVVMTAVLMILYKIVHSSKGMSITKILLFINSLVINDLSLRKYEGKIRNEWAFLLLLFQKFMSIFIGKLSLYGELPTLWDSSIVALLAIHFITFTFFHTHLGEELMNKIKQSEVRRVLQETFKGYGKGLNLIALVNKGMKLHANPLYFLAVLLVRGSASATFKATCVGLFVTKKRIKLKKARINLLFITIPSIALFLLQYILHNHVDALAQYAGRECGQECINSIQQPLTHFFILLMVVSRCMRALCKVLKNIQNCGKGLPMTPMSMISREHSMMSITESIWDRQQLELRSPINLIECIPEETKTLSSGRSIPLTRQGLSTSNRALTLLNENRYHNTPSTETDSLTVEDESPVTRRLPTRSSTLGFSSMNSTSFEQLLSLE